MLSFDIRSLESQAAHVDGTVLPDDPVWEAGDMRPTEPIHVEGRLSAAGPTRFYFSGRMTGVIEMPCRRCLEDVKVEVSEEEHFIFSAEGEAGSDDEHDHRADYRQDDLCLDDRRLPRRCAASSRPECENGTEHRRNRQAQRGVAKRFELSEPVGFHVSSFLSRLAPSG